MAMKQHIALAVAAVLLPGLAKGAYEFSDRASGLSITLPADWECTTDIVKENTGVFEFSGMGLGVVLQYDVGRNWQSSQQRAEYIIDKAKSTMDNLQVISEDSLVLWGLPAHEIVYRASFQKTNRIARVISVVSKTASLSIIFVRENADEWQSGDQKVMQSFLKGVSFAPPGDQSK